MSVLSFILIGLLLALLLGSVYRTNNLSKQLHNEIAQLREHNKLQEASAEKLMQSLTNYKQTCDMLRTRGDIYKAGIEDILEMNKPTLISTARLMGERADMARKQVLEACSGKN